MSRASTFCRIASFSELLGWTRRPLTAWLSPREQDELRRWRATARRTQWLAGRAIAKALILDCQCDVIDPLQVEILSLSANGLGMRPQVRIGGRPADLDLSLAHADGAAAVAIRLSADQRVGIDLVSAHDPQLHSTLAHHPRQWFTSRELNAFASAAMTPALAWAAKEAVFKAASQGEAFEPRAIEVLTTEQGASTAECRYHEAIFKLDLWHEAGHTAVVAIACQERRAYFLQPLEVQHAP